MIRRQRYETLVGPAILALLLALAAGPAAAAESVMAPSGLTDFATRYAAAWSSQDPAQLASFYAGSGRLIVNGGEAAVGRAAIEAKAQGFMEAFPDMRVVLDRVDPRPGGAVFHWIWTGTNSGPGGTGRAVHLTGHEDWTFDDSGLILESDGHYDEAEYLRQVNGEGG